MNGHLVNAVQVLILTPGNVSEWTLTEHNEILQFVYNPLREAAQPMNEDTHDVIKPKTVTNSPRAYHESLKTPPTEHATSQTVNAGLFPGQCITLDPADTICLTYSQAPTWRWKALR